MAETMIVLFTDFGTNSPYVGQMKAAIYSRYNSACIIDLFATAPACNPGSAAHLLAAYVGEFDKETVFLCVVDPGVGNAQRKAVVAEIDGRYFVGPDNGLFDVVAARAGKAARREIIWRPKRLSATFHGRDLFAPVAAELAQGTLPHDWLAEAQPYEPTDVAAGLAEIIFIDDYGNAITGIRAEDMGPDAQLKAGGRILQQCRAFFEGAPGEPFWYENSNGLVEIAVNRGSASILLGLTLGMPVEVVEAG
jgi:S-adenosylmethionine hydrolase